MMNLNKKWFVFNSIRVRAINLIYCMTDMTSYFKSERHSEKHDIFENAGGILTDMLNLKMRKTF